MDVLDRIRTDWEQRACVDAGWWSAPGRGDADAAADLTALLGDLPERLGPDATVLDFGCGDGRLTEGLTAHFLQVVGVDIAPSMVLAAQGRGGAAHYQRTLGLDLGAVPPGSLHGVVSHDVLPHLPVAVVGGVLAAISEGLRAGGLLRHCLWMGPQQLPLAHDTLSVRVHDAEAVLAAHAHAGLKVIGPLETPAEPEPVWIEAEKVGPPQPFDAPAACPDEPAESQLGLEYEVWMYRAGELAEAGDGHRAEAALEAATQAQPQRPEAWMQWAMHRLQRDDLKGAALLFEQLTDLDPNNPIAWLHRAQVAEAQEAWPEARAAIARLKALDGMQSSGLEADIEAIEQLIPPQ